MVVSHRGITMVPAMTPAPVIDSAVSGTANAGTERLCLTVTIRFQPIYVALIMANFTRGEMSKILGNAKSGNLFPRISCVYK